MEPRFASSRRPRPLRQAREKRGSAGAELDSAPGALLLAPGQRPMTPQRQAVELIVVHEKSLRAAGRLALGGALAAVARGPGRAPRELVQVAVDHQAGRLIRLLSRGMGPLRLLALS